MIGTQSTHTNLQKRRERKAHSRERKKPPAVHQPATQPDQYLLHSRLPHNGSCFWCGLPATDWGNWGSEKRRCSILTTRWQAGMPTDTVHADDIWTPERAAAWRAEWEPILSEIVGASDAGAVEENGEKQENV